MSRPAVLRTWNETSEVSRNFKIETKLTDFGNLYADKSITGVGINLTQDSNNDASIMALFELSYRKNSTHEYIPLQFIQVNTSTSLSYRYIFNAPIKDIKTFQLKIQSPYIEGPIGITDIEVFYREYRDISTTRLDEGF